jgi:methylated-DNA-[protein]-cysteine S-methyltransferase
MNKSIVERTFNTPIGGIEVVAGNIGLRQVNLFGSNNPPKMINSEPGDELHTAQQIARQALQEILEYLHKGRTVFNILIDWDQMTTFQRQVLRATSQIPFGQVYSYGQLAKLLGNANASRAVGGALARNPMPIIIPCHRVVAANGYLTGFSAADGIRTKQWLLEMEGRKIVDQKLA